MTKPKFRRDPARTRERIFEAATDLFAERGFSGVTMSHIADAAQVNRRMIYVYFGDKEGVYRSVMERAFELAWLPVLDSIEASHGTEHPAEALRAALLAYFDSLTANPKYVRLLAWEAASGWEVVNRFDSPVLRQAGQRQRDVLGTGIEAGIFRKDLDLRLVPTLLTSLPFFFFLYRPRLVHSLRTVMDSVDIEGLNESARAFFADAALRTLKCSDDAESCHATRTYDAQPQDPLLRRENGHRHAPEPVQGLRS
jgi:AcrR family transcriptional regulator